MRFSRFVAIVFYVAALGQEGCLTSPYVSVSVALCPRRHPYASMSMLEFVGGEARHLTCRGS